MAKTKSAARPRPSRQDGERTNREAIEAEESATTKMKKKRYEEELARLQLELIKLQEWIKHAGLKVVVIFEGRDAAGKGGRSSGSPRA
jgi:polyphosphate kinase 2 (PPK2 family)